MYDKLNTDDEIAAVLAHETGHIVARHAVKRLQAAYGSAIFVILGSQARSPGTGRAVAAIDSLMLHNSREDELFADKLSVKYAKKAGFNPEGVVKVLQFLWETQKKEPIRPYVSEMTHPYLSVRLSEAKQEVNGKMDFNDYINLPTDTGR